MLQLFTELSREMKYTRHITYFATNLKTQVQRKESPDPDVTFRPKINEKSLKILSRQGSGGELNSYKRGPSPCFDRLYQHSKEIQEKKNKRKEELQKEDDMQLTFKPTISSRPTNKVEAPKAAFERLYGDSKREPKVPVDYRPYAEQEMDECTFKPNIQELKSSSPEQIKIKGYDRAVHRFRTKVEEKKDLQKKKWRKKLEERIMRKIARKKLFPLKQPQKFVNVKNRNSTRSHSTQNWVQTKTQKFIFANLIILTNSQPNILESIISHKKWNESCEKFFESKRLLLNKNCSYTNVIIFGVLGFWGFGVLGFWGPCTLR
eukprot:TRINITY_DN9584_c0_g1_i2.p1 TRINITY_DN9584_c0_g1~~TRINITY_DN9584_c0_g1_i2.p1  ORF type:complete len:319 (-),score=33.36 TRINITY_DN9584_c0_g1_i2:4-960(-)